MTEEIIIDGVNVAGCNRLKTYKNWTHSSNTWCGLNMDESGCECEQRPTCYYKQLQRLEQENKALNFKINQLKANGLYNDLTGIELSAKIVELEQENKELKEENKQHIKEKQILNERLYCYAYEKDCHLVCKQQNCLLKNSYIYRSALEEMRKDFICFRSCILPFHIGDKDKIPHSMADAIQNYCESIKNKIDEVLE